jgi:O-succinylhomoserine sulfhydrylase
MDGQGRVLGGAVLGRKKWVDEVLQPFIRNTGPSISPFNAWVILKGLETLHLRLPAMCRSAAAIADFLAERSEIARVLYPFRADHPQVTLAKAQMAAGGSLVTFDVKGGKEAAFRFMNALRIVDVSNNLGDAKSLATHPATTTHMRVGAEERAKLGITDGTIRLSVGLEDVADLIADLSEALDAIAPAPAPTRRVVLPIEPAPAAAPQAEPAEAAKPKRGRAKEVKPAEPAAPLLFDLAAPLPDAPGRGD